MSAESDAEVRAAGGVVVRGTGDDREVAVVHRPRYDDWSLPKGKLDSGESFEQAALREVEEETGLRCDLGEQIGDTTYTDHKGRSKVVRYWAMSPRAGEFEPNDEVDELKWLPLGDAADALSYPYDRELIGRLLSS